jgi:hypothetical protein
VLGAPSPVPGPAAQQAAREELRHAEYHRDDPTLIGRLFSWAGRQVGRLLSGSPGGNAMLILLVLLAIVIVFAIVRAGPPRRRVRAEAGESDLLRPLAAADHRRLAQEHERAGRSAEALREWLRAAIADIEDRGILPRRPGRTGAATAREAGFVLPSAAAALRAATTAFDEVWFGERPAGPADVTAARQAADLVRDARPAGPGSVAKPTFMVPQ